MRLLLVEDEDELADFMAEELRDASIEVVRVVDGLTALAALASTKFEVIVSDVDMPGMDGLEFLRKARLIVPDVPFILMSGGVQITEELAVETGAIQLLRKPFPCARLIALLNALVP